MTFGEHAKIPEGSAEDVQLIVLYGISEQFPRTEVVIGLILFNFLVDGRRRMAVTMAKWQ